MKLEEKKYLLDILESIQVIEQYLGKNRVFEDFNRNQQLQDAIIRRLEIIGLATNKLLKENPDILISNSRKIVGFRNKVAHEYDRISLENIWAILIKYLPTLKDEVEKLLNTSTGH